MVQYISVCIIITCFMCVQYMYVYYMYMYLSSRCASIGGSDLPVHSDAAVSKGEFEGLAGPKHSQPPTESRLKLLPTGITGLTCVCKCVCIDHCIGSRSPVYYNLSF